MQRVREQGQEGYPGNVSFPPQLCWLLGAGEKRVGQAAWESDTAFVYRFLH